MLVKSQKMVSLEDWDGYVIDSENVLDYTELVTLFTKLPLSYRAVLEMKNKFTENQGGALLCHGKQKPVQKKRLKS